MPAIVKEPADGPMSEFDVEFLHDELIQATAWMHDETEPIEERAAAAHWVVRIENRLRQAGWGVNHAKVDDELRQLDRRGNHG